MSICGQKVGLIAVVLARVSAAQVNAVSPNYSQSRFVADADGPENVHGQVRGPHAVCPDGSVQYSGFLSAGGDVKYFFWLAEARGDVPRPVPLVIWLNGGPGCSSMTGLLTENGPCSVAGGNASSGWQLQRNPWSWNSEAHVLWIDQPAGVGFSVGSIHHADETAVAEHMLAFLRNFYAHFPKFIKMPLFVFGESYAGHYIPAIAARLVFAESELPYIHLAGIGMGNAAVDPVRQWTSMPEMACTGGEGGSLRPGLFSESECKSFQQAIPGCVAAMDSCKHGSKADCFGAQMACSAPFLAARKLGLNTYDLRKPCPAGDLICSGPADHRTELFLKDANVQQALGVFHTQNWQMCNLEGAGFNFIASGDYYTGSDEHVKFLLANSVPVLVYNGDCDLAVNWLGDKAWAETLDWPHQEAWLLAPDDDFIVDGRVVGQERSSHGLTFVQVYNAGHMVPQDQPRVALALLQRFVSANSPWRQSHALAAKPLELTALPASLAVAAVAAVTLAVALAAKAAWWRKTESSEPYMALP